MIFYFTHTQKKSYLATQHWINIGQNTCWVILTQMVGLNVFTHHAGLFNILFKNDNIAGLKWAGNEKSYT